jgi:hypothetical protein
VRSAHSRDGLAPFGNAFVLRLDQHLPVDIDLLACAAGNRHHEARQPGAVAMIPGFASARGGIAGLRSKAADPAAVRMRFQSALALWPPEACSGQPETIRGVFRRARS